MKNTLLLIGVLIVAWSCEEKPSLQTKSTAQKHNVSSTAVGHQTSEKNQGLGVNGADAVHDTNSLELDAMNELMVVPSVSDTLRTIIKKVHSVYNWVGFKSMEYKVYSDGHYQYMYYSQPNYINKISCEAIDSNEITNLYFSNHELIMANYQHKEASIGSGVLNDSVFFIKGMVVKVKEDGDCGAPFSMKYLEYKGNEMRSLLNKAIEVHYSLDSLVSVLNTCSSLAQNAIVSRSEESVQKNKQDKSELKRYQKRKLFPALNWIALSFCNTASTELIEAYIKMLTITTEAAVKEAYWTLVQMYLCQPDLVLSTIAKSEKSMKLKKGLGLGIIEVYDNYFDAGDPLIMKVEAFLGFNLSP